MKRFLSIFWILILSSHSVLQASPQVVKFVRDATYYDGLRSEFFFAKSNHSNRYELFVREGSTHILTEKPRQILYNLECDFGDYASFSCWDAEFEFSSVLVKSPEFGYQFKIESPSNVDANLKNWFWMLESTVFEPDSTKWNHVMVFE